MRAGTLLGFKDLHRHVKLIRYLYIKRNHLPLPFKSKMATVFTLIYKYPHVVQTRSSNHKSPDQGEITVVA